MDKIFVLLLVVYTKTILMSPSVLINISVSYWKHPTLKRRTSGLKELKVFSPNLMLGKSRFGKYAEKSVLSCCIFLFHPFP